MYQFDIHDIHDLILDFYQRLCMGDQITKQKALCHINRQTYYQIYKYINKLINQQTNCNRTLHGGGVKQKIWKPCEHFGLVKGFQSTPFELSSLICTLITFPIEILTSRLSTLSSILLAKLEIFLVQFASSKTTSLHQ